MIEAGNMNPGYEFEISRHHEACIPSLVHLSEYTGALFEIFDTKSRFIPQIDSMGLGVEL